MINNVNKFVKIEISGLGSIYLEKPTESKKENFPFFLVKFGKNPVSFLLLFNLNTSPLFSLSENNYLREN